jgi:hypothetical protein
MTVVEWLLDSDPSIRWQVMRDLTDEPDDVVAAERSRVASEGWGARCSISRRLMVNGVVAAITPTGPRPTTPCCYCGTWAWIRRVRKPVEL